MTLEVDAEARVKLDDGEKAPGMDTEDVELALMKLVVMIVKEAREVVSEAVEGLVVLVVDEEGMAKVGTACVELEGAEVLDEVKVTWLLAGLAVVTAGVDVDANVDVDVDVIELG